MENQQVETQVEQVQNVAPDVWGGTTPEVAHKVEETPPVVGTPEPPATVDVPVVTPAAEVVEPTIQEKIVEVEKIIEKHPEFKDDYSKQIYQAILDGKEEELKSYFDEKFRDYTVISDRENIEYKLKKENPSWSQKDIESEIKFKYGKTFDRIDTDSIDADLEPEKYQRAIAHNEDVERRELMLERDGRDARLWNNEQKKAIELPKIPTAEATPQTPALTQEQIDESNREWEAKVVAGIPTVSDFKFDIDGEEVSYKITDQEKGVMTEYMKQFEVKDYLTKRGWFDAEGNPNVKAITEDVYKLENIKKIIASTATQMKTEATKKVVAEIKNLDLTTPQGSPELSADVPSMIWGNA